MTEPRNKKRAAWERATQHLKSRSPEEIAAEKAEMERIRAYYDAHPEEREKANAAFDEQVDPGIY